MSGQLMQAKNCLQGCQREANTNYSTPEMLGNQVKFINGTRHSLVSAL
jgi:hypothetical protein